MIDLTKNLATMNRRTKSSVIRELLKLTNRPEIISFAGGLPNPLAFPTEHMAEITMKVIKERAMSKTKMILSKAGTSGFIKKISLPMPNPKA